MSDPDETIEETFQPGAVVQAEVPEGPTGKVALISDIHGNLEALEAVLAHIAEQGIKRIFCLGDVIGYGPNPVECLRRSFEFDVVLMGNHEEAAVYGAYIMSPIARSAIDWTRDQLLEEEDGEELLEFCSNLPLIYCEDDVTLAHGSPRDPTVEYVLKKDCEDLFGDVPEKIREIFALFPRLCFIGHTHDPGVITPSGMFLGPKDIGMRFHCDPTAKYLVNVGSVGQPRDGDNRSCYVVLEGLQLTYHRVEYDVATTVGKIRAVPELHERCASRLETGR